MRARRTPAASMQASKAKKPRGTRFRGEGHGEKEGDLKQHRSKAQQNFSFVKREVEAHPPSLKILLSQNGPTWNGLSSSLGASSFCSENKQTHEGAGIQRLLNDDARHNGGGERLTSRAPPASGVALGVLEAGGILQQFFPDLLRV